jgi:hypothetical protein
MMFFFLFLACLLGVCLTVGVIEAVLERRARRALHLKTLERDVRVKDRRIHELHLEIAMLRAAMHMQETVLATRLKRQKPYLVENVPALLRPQI